MVFSVHNHGFYGVSNTFCQEKHQHFHADRQLVTKKEISIKINYENNVKRPWPSGLVTGISRRRAGFDTQWEQEFFPFFFLWFFFFNKTTWMRVFSQINNCQQKQNKKKQNKKQKQNTDKTKRGAPLLGLAKSIYYTDLAKPKNGAPLVFFCWNLFIFKVITKKKLGQKFPPSGIRT